MAQTTRRSTGIPGLDLSLDGGFPPGTRIVVYGSPLSGMELMAQQFWRTESETGSYLMLDADPKQGMIAARGLSLEEMAEAMQGDRIVVDSLSTLVITSGIDAAVDLLVHGAADVLKRGANVMCLFYRGLHTPLEEIRVMRAADIFITLRQEIHGNEFERTLAIEKIRGMQVPQRVIPYHITAKGLELSTTSRVI